ncbi:MULTISPECIES: hypothetical protein [unclassified Clostridium]|uniref:hypothetical protein n=1 Tax=unclassified Clostridium TaxID=2614128 RepID=UPI000297598F|nr:MULTISPECIES: hypothetical protein [unclassified Clostridium]EKQ55102.1 MAG: hypothetical protein A370_02876 [Clostridium sp. Maddingley MBC34-26]
MSSYRSAYENYYKNINNRVNGKKDKNNYFHIGRKNNDSISSKYGINSMKNNKSFTDILIKRVIRELTGATILLFFFTGLKYIPSEQVREMHIKCKQLLAQNFDYNEYLQMLNTLQIGNFKVKDLNLDNLTTEELKTKAFNFWESLKSGGGIDTGTDTEGQL